MYPCDPRSARFALTGNMLGDWICKLIIHQEDIR
jgi:hypothetical protein